ncbi:putative ABI family protein [Helianthus annuus]|uniref:ABI family protein n=1 Tax=Helianthus annuus TaxID=4232 RepID=A0A251V3V1_HELAN|nr:protein ABIL1 [Helianthus annuus]KAF5811557.1 putative ABI family protein [Helianthus annuus]
MEVEQSNQAMMFNEPSMEPSIGFVKALQELKNLRPQLYSAAEYCEKSYLHSEQKQVVLDNLKDYAVRALVNAVDHLGTVAYKLTDLLEQQTLEISTTGLHISCLHQQLLTCQTYTDREALRQQQLLAVVPRHHKHYSLPNSVSKKVHFSPQVQTGAKQSHYQSRPRQFVSGTPAANTLCWHLASETKSTLKRNSSSMSIDAPKTSGRATASSHASNGNNRVQTKSSESHHRVHKMGPASSTAIETLGISRQDNVEGPRTVMSFRSFDNPRQEVVQAPIRSKSVLSSFFVKQKTPKLRTGLVS